MRRATAQSTEAPGRPTPEPVTAPLTTWVVDNGKPKCEEARITVAATSSEEKPCGGRTSVTLVPSVLMIRQPPAKVPSAIATPHETMTHVGTVKSAPPERLPLE